MEPWAVYVVAVSTPVLAFVGAFLGHWVTRKGAVELDRWRRREETMRMLRWAAEQALKPGGAGRVGVAALGALGQSELLQPEDQDFVDTVLLAIAAPMTEAYAPGDAFQEEEG